VRRLSLVDEAKSRDHCLVFVESLVDLKKVRLSRGWTIRRLKTLKSTSVAASVSSLSPKNAVSMASAGGNQRVLGLPPVFS
jgi:hypothetical protein